MTLYSELAQISRDAWAAQAAARSASAAASRAARAAARSASAAASRAARSAASHSARSAAVAASRAARSAAAAAAEAARGAYNIRCCEYPEEEEERRRIRTGTVPVLTRELVPGVDVTDKDFESDKALWALYEQWCKAYNKVRDHSDMVRRFNIFKNSAEFVLSYNKAHEGMPGKHGCLGPYADGLDARDIVERKAALEAAGYSHLLSLIDSMGPPTPQINSSP